MQRSPKYKPIEVNSAKDRQKYLKTLYDEVNKSRMAVVILSLLSKPSPISKTPSSTSKRKSTKSRNNFTPPCPEWISKPKETYLLPHSGHSQRTQYPHEGRNVQFPKNPKTRRRKSWVRSLKKNQKTPVWYRTNPPKAQRGNRQNHLPSGSRHERKIRKSRLLQPLQKTRKVNQTKRRTLQRKPHQKWNRQRQVETFKTNQSVCGKKSHRSHPLK